MQGRSELCFATLSEGCRLELYAPAIHSGSLVPYTLNPEVSLGFGAGVLWGRLEDLGLRAVGTEGFWGVQGLVGLGFKALGQVQEGGVSVWGA